MRRAANLETCDLAGCYDPNEPTFNSMCPQGSFAGAIVIFVAEKIADFLEVSRGLGRSMRPPRHSDVGSHVDRRTGDTSENHAS